MNEGTFHKMASSRSGCSSKGVGGLRVSLRRTRAAGGCPGSNRFQRPAAYLCRGEGFDKNTQRGALCRGPLGDGAFLDHAPGDYHVRIPAKRSSHPHERLSPGRASAPALGHGDAGIGKLDPGGAVDRTGRRGPGDAAETGGEKRTIEKAFYAIWVSIDATACSAHACPPAEGPGLLLYAAGMLVLKYIKTCGPAISSSSGRPITPATSEYTCARVNLSTHPRVKA